MIKKILINLIILNTTLIFFGCGGRTANPIMSYYPGDEQKSCKVIEIEMMQIQDNIRKLLPKESKAGKNLALGAGGLLFFPVWFFMDFKDAEKIEIESYKNRYNYLVKLYTEKQCGKKTNK